MFDIVSVRGGLIDVIQQMDKFLCRVNFTFVPWFDTSTVVGGRLMKVIFCILRSSNNPVLYLPTNYTYLCPID
jgi:hypothetical protein